LLAACLDARNYSCGECNLVSDDLRQPAARWAPLNSSAVTVSPRPQGLRSYTPSKLLRPRDDELPMPLAHHRLNRRRPRATGGPPFSPRTASLSRAADSALEAQLDVAACSFSLMSASMLVGARFVFADGPKN